MNENAPRLAGVALALPESVVAAVPPAADHPAAHHRLAGPAPGCAADRGQHLRRPRTRPDRRPCRPDGRRPRPRDPARIRRTQRRRCPCRRPERARLTGLLVHQADSGDPAAYRGAVPADLVLAAGVFGSIDDADIRTTIAALPQLCGPEATVIWTRSRRPPDRTGAILTWLAETGLTEVSFTAPPDDLFSVGVHRLTATPQPLTATTPLFRFTRN